MPKFAYSAIDASGAEVEGTTKADTIGSARSTLVEKNLFPIKIAETKGMLDFELTKKKVKKKAKAQAKKTDGGEEDAAESVAPDVDADTSMQD